MKKCIECGKKFNPGVEEEEFDELFNVNFPGWIDGIGYYGYQDDGPLCAACAIERVREESEESEDEY